MAGISDREIHEYLFSSPKNAARLLMALSRALEQMDYDDLVEHWERPECNHNWRFVDQENIYPGKYHVYICDRCAATDARLIK